MALFYVDGPHNVPVKKCKVGRRIEKEQANQFWSENNNLEKLTGCYIFAIKAAKGIKPMYIGKATRSFSQELFNDRNKGKYNQVLADTKKGKAVLFFICLSKSKGPINTRAIDEVETHLIQSGLFANPKSLLNKQKTKIQKWSIEGIIRSGKGKSSKSSRELKKCLKL